MNKLSRKKKELSCLCVLLARDTLRAPCPFDFHPCRPTLTIYIIPFWVLPHCLLCTGLMNFHTCTHWTLSTCRHWTLSTCRLKFGVEQIGTNGCIKGRGSTMHGALQSSRAKWFPRLVCLIADWPTYLKFLAHTILVKPTNHNFWLLRCREFEGVRRIRAEIRVTLARFQQCGRWECPDVSCRGGLHGVSGVWVWARWVLTRILVLHMGLQVRRRGCAVLRAVERLRRAAVHGAEGRGQGLLLPAGTHRAGEQQLPNLSCSFRRLLPVIFLYRILFLCFPILLQVSVCFLRDRNMVSVALTSCLLFLCSLSCGHNEFVFRWHSSRVFP